MAELRWCNQPCVELLGFPAVWEHAAWPCLGYGLVRPCNASHNPSPYGIWIASQLCSGSGDSSMHKSRVWSRKKAMENHDLPILSWMLPKLVCSILVKKTNYTRSTPMGCILALPFWKKPHVFYSNSSSVQVAMPAARKATGSWAVQASLMSRHPGHVSISNSSNKISISMCKGPATCWTNFGWQYLESWMVLQHFEWS